MTPTSAAAPSGPVSVAAESQPIKNAAQLVEDLETGCKPKDLWRIGTEHEKFGYHLSDLSPVEFGGDDGVRAMLTGLQRFGWAPVYEGDNVIALKQDGASITLEPGGQFELSGAPLESLHQTCDEVHTHLAQVEEVAKELGLGFIGVGFSPKWTMAETPMMPKSRYKIMRSYMEKVGTHGHDMMFRSCTVQTNLDFSSEADMVKKFRVALALQPIATAMFANSPFTEGKPNGYLSYRSYVWQYTDDDRTGMLPFVFEDGFGFERYVDYVLDTPMYLVERDGALVDLAGQSFRAFMDGKLERLPGERPDMDDWMVHMTTVFPEVRLKHYLEMRGADGGPWARLCALPALWVGLLYDDTALDAAWDLVKDWTEEERRGLRQSVPRDALNTPFRQHTVKDIAGEVMAIAHAGLKARASLDWIGEDEGSFLNALDQIVEDGCTPAEEMLARYNGEWGGDIDRVFADYSY